MAEQLSMHARVLTHAENCYLSVTALSQLHLHSHLIAATLSIMSL